MAANVKEMMKLIGVAEQVAYTREYQIMWTAPEKEKEFVKDFDALTPIFLQEAENYFMNNYSYEESNNVIMFYKSAVGKKIVAANKRYIELYTAAKEKQGEKFEEIYFSLSNYKRKD